VAPSAETLSFSRGWQWDYDRAANRLSSITETQAAEIRYDPQAAAYFGRFPLVGDGRIFQTGAQFQAQLLLEPSYQAAVAPDAPSATSQSGLYVLRTRPEYQHVAAVQWYDTDTPAGAPEQYGFGVVGVVQPTPAAAIPMSGNRRYLGSVNSYLSGNFADTVGGTIDVHFDFTTGAFTLNLDLALICFMGCGYPTAPVLAVATNHARGAVTFAGDLQIGGAAGRGTFQGRFAGPEARELLIEFRAPYLNPETKSWTEISGIAIAKVA